MKEAIRKHALELGFDLVGFADANFLGEAPQGKRPVDYLPKARTLISLGKSLNRGSLVNLDKTRNQYYMEYLTCNALVDSLTFRLVNWLDTKEVISIPIGTSGHPDLHKELAGDISSKHAAVAAGLGLFGINNLLITPEYGPRLRLATIITEADLPPDRPLGEAVQKKLKEGCETCRKCVEGCPTGAFHNWEKEFSPVTGWRIEKEKCFHYQNICLSGKRCGLCVAACPQAVYGN